MFRRQCCINIGHQLAQKENISELMEEQSLQMICDSCPRNHIFSTGLRIIFDICCCPVYRRLSWKKSMSRKKRRLGATPGMCRRKTKRRRFRMRGQPRAFILTTPSKTLVLHAISGAHKKKIKRKPWPKKHLCQPIN